MVQPEIEPPTPTEYCRAAAALLLERHQWRLLDPETLAARAAEQMQLGVALNPERAVVGAYCLALHAACSGREGQQRQNLAYDELGRYLYAHARAHYPDVYAEAAQIALERVYETFDRCRKPIAFLAFALQRLMDAARSVRRQRKQAPLSLNALLGEGGERQGEEPADAGADLPTQAIDRELRAELTRVLRAFLAAHPRSSQQVAALWFKYVEGWDDAAISHWLGVSVPEVHVLRSRAKKKLRNDPQWRQLAAQFGIREEDEP